MSMICELLVSVRAGQGLGFRVKVHVGLLILAAICGTWRTIIPTDSYVFLQSELCNSVGSVYADLQGV